MQRNAQYQFGIIDKQINMPNNLHSFRLRNWDLVELRITSFNCHNEICNVSEAELHIYIKKRQLDLSSSLRILA